MVWFRELMLETASSPYLIFYEDGTKIWYKAKGVTLAPAEQQD